MYANMLNLYYLAWQRNHFSSSFDVLSLCVGCDSMQCSPGFQCVSDPDTGFGSCVGVCEESVSGCRSDQLCRIRQYNCDPSPCQYPVCYNAPYGRQMYMYYHRSNFDCEILMIVNSSFRVFNQRIAK